MRYKKAKKLVIKDFEKNGDPLIRFGWKFRWYPRLRKSMKKWARDILEA